jgi:hypothetical protein
MQNFGGQGVEYQNGGGQNKQDQDDEYIAIASQVDQTLNEEEAEVDEDYSPAIDTSNQYANHSKRPSASTAGKSKSAKRADRSRVVYKPDNSVAVQMRQQNEDQYKRQNLSSRRTKQSGLSMLNTIIEKIIDQCCVLDEYQLFKDRVRKEVAPGYDQIIKHPIWLGLMRQKCRREEYRNISELLQDMIQLRINAEIYNGVNHAISQVAEGIEKLDVRLSDE